MPGAIRSYGWPRYAIAGTLAAIALVLHLRAGNELAGTGVLHEWDVLFSADPTVYVTSFTTGQNTYRWGGRSFVHPNISNVLYPVVHAAAGVVHALRPGMPEHLAARRVAYAICPLASAATAALLFLTFAELEVGLGTATLPVLVYLASFSGLVFGSIPESYCLSGLAFAGLFLLTVRSLKDGPGAHGRKAAWVAMGALVGSITITNLAPFALVAGAVRLRRGSWRSAVAWSAGVTTAALLVTVAGYAVGARVWPRAAPPFTPGASGQLEERHRFEPATAFVEFPIGVANTLAPPVPVKAPADPALHQAMGFTLTYHTASRADEWWRALAILVVLVASIAGARSLPAWQRPLVAAAVLMIVFNWVLHVFYGSEMFLYSQHWAIAMLVVLVGLAGARGPHRLLARGVLVLLLAFCVANSVTVWHAVLDMLRQPDTMSAQSAIAPSGAKR